MSSASAEAPHRDVFTQDLMRDAERDGLRNRRVGLQDVIDLLRSDFLAAPVDRLFDPAPEKEVAVLIEVARVSGMEPTKTERVGIGFRVILITGHDVVAADYHLADFTRF